MSCLTFLSENFIDESNISLSLGTANAQFPLTNIKNESTVKKFRSVENSIKIVFDMQQTRSIDSIALVGDATQTIGITSASVKFSLTTDFSSFTAVNIPVDAQYGMGFYLWAAPMSYRYAELTITGNGTFCELSNIFIGKRIDLLHNSLSIGSFRYGTKDKGNTSTNDYGQKFVNKRNKVKYISGDVEFCNKEEFDLLDNMYIRHQRTMPLWMIVDQNSEGMNEGQYKLSIYGYMEGSPDWSAFGGQHYSSHIRIDQAV